MSFFSRRHEFLNGSLRVTVDLSCLAGAYVLSVELLRPTDIEFLSCCRNYLPYLFALAVVWALVAPDQRLHLSRNGEAIVTLLFSVAKAFSTVYLFSVLVGALFMREDLSLTFLFVHGLMALGLLLQYRLLLGLSLWNLRRRGFNL